jgi:hypothetical protein
MSSKNVSDHLIKVFTGMNKNKHLGQRLLDFFRKSQPRHSSKEIDPLIPVIVRMLRNTVDDELSCDDVLELVDQYADLASKNEAAAALFPLIRLHLDRCSDCLEEYEALQRILESPDSWSD